MSRTGICIPVAADPDGLDQTLHAIAAVPDARDAVIVVAVDGADPETVAVAGRHGARYVTLPGSRGSYAARNAAVAVLPDDVDVVLFTDAGCRPRSGWVDRHREALTSVAMSGGGVVITTSARPTPAEWVDLNRNLQQERYVVNDGFAATCNLGVRRKVLDALSFDDRLRSGGDRDFGERARDAGFEIAYVADAVVEHDARGSGRAVIEKARRVGLGVGALAGHGRSPRLPNHKPGLALVRKAVWQRRRRSPLWLLRVAWIDNRRAAVLHAAATTPRPVDLHVVVMLASRWDSLETFSTRWREVVLAWARDPRIDALTVVDHPAMRRRALIARRLVEAAPSWAVGVDRERITLPVGPRPMRADTVAFRRVARQLQRSWPAASRRVIVAATPFAAPLLQPLRTPTTTVAFDGVDHWNLRRRFAGLTDRVESGYAAGARADVVTAVAPTLADDLCGKGAASPVVVANGVDVEALTSPAPRPDIGLPTSPYAVFVGTVGGRIDVDLLVEMAESLDEDAVVVAGPAADATIERRLRDSRVRWLGPVAPELIPGLLQAAGCGLLPYRDTGLFDATDSMKLLQYLAVGLPVVSTDLPGLPDRVFVARTPAEFAAQIRVAVAVGHTEPSDRVALNDWSRVADRLLALYLAGAR